MSEVSVKSGPRRLQFSTRALILTCLIVSAPLAWVAGVKYEAAKFRRTADIVSNEFIAIRNEPAVSTNPLKSAIQNAIDRDAYQQINYLGWTGNRHLTSELAFVLQEVPGLQEIQFSRYGVGYDRASGGRVKWTDQELHQIVQIKSLASINLDGVYSAEAVKPLLKLPLHQLILHDTPLSNDLAERLCRCESLNSVGFDMHQATQSQSRQLARLQNLTQLCLHRIVPGRSYFAELETCKNLRGLQLYDTQVSEAEGVSISKLRLRQVQLIDCQFASGFFSALKADRNVPEVVISTLGNVQVYSPTYAALAELEKRHAMSIDSAQPNEKSPKPTGPQ